MTEKQIDLIVERLVRRTEEANVYFLKKIGEYIKEIRELRPTEAYQLVQILKYGGSYEEIVKQISKYTDLNIKDIDDIFYNYAQQDYSFYERFYQYKNIPFIPLKENVILRQQALEIASIVKKEMYNYTKSNMLGYSIKGLNGKTQFVGLKDTYVKVLDESLLNVSQGKETFDSAMSRIMKNIGDSGLKTVDYASGRSVRLDSTINMHLKSKLKELHNANQEIIGKEIGADGVEISVHQNPAIDHEKIQGRQFSNSEFEKLQNGEVAIDYTGKAFTLDHDGKNGYRPISELNCQHIFYSIVLGVSSPEYTEEQLKEIRDKNNKGFEYKGKHYTMYEGTQLQRTIEREIRKEKDTQILAVAADNKELISKSQENIKYLTKMYNELNNISGLPSKPHRLKVENYKKVAI